MTSLAEDLDRGKRIIECPYAKPSMPGKRVGTSHYFTYGQALKAYAGNTAKLDNAITEGVVSIGNPPCPDSATFTVDSDGRYWLVYEHWYSVWGGQRVLLPARLKWKAFSSELPPETGWWPVSYGYAIPGCYAALVWFDAEKAEVSHLVRATHAPEEAARRAERRNPANSMGYLCWADRWWENPLAVENLKGKS